MRVAKYLDKYHRCLCLTAIADAVATLLVSEWRYELRTDDAIKSTMRLNTYSEDVLQINYVKCVCKGYLILSTCML